MAVYAPITPAHRRASFAPVPQSAVSRLLARFDRAALEGFIEVAIDLLDMADGDADREPDGDEMDGDPRAEDEFHPHERDGPGCPCADPDLAVDDHACDPESCGGSL
ncbi:MAG: hypothetical protein K2Y20_07125 [Sphingomonas sp.]|nr:hypothetical protein [Sphingomonas sp.]